MGKDKLKEKKPVEVKTFTEEEVKELIKKEAVEMAAKIVDDSKVIEAAVEKAELGAVTPTIDVFKGSDKITITNDEKNRTIYKVRGYLPR